MKKSISIIIIVLMTITLLNAQHTAYSDPALTQKAAQIAKTFKLDKQKELQVCKILDHVKQRTADLPLGHPEYKKLLDYINQERLDMMYSLLGNEKDFKNYQKLYNAEESIKIDELNSNNQEYIRANGTLTMEKVENNLTETEEEPKVE